MSIIEVGILKSNFYILNLNIYMGILDFERNVITSNLTIMFIYLFF